MPRQTRPYFISRTSLRSPTRPSLLIPLLPLLLLDIGDLLLGSAVIVSAISTNSKQFRNCDILKAESCFQQLFDAMPFCSASHESAELTFRCQHFNVLDICFREHSIMCPPTAIGLAARNAYRRRLSHCQLNLGKNSHVNAPIDEVHGGTSSEKSLQQRHSDTYPANHRHHRQHQSHSSQNQKHAHMSIPSPSFEVPSEHQFISVFGYLQTQCRRRRTAPSSNAESNSSRRNSHRGAIAMELTSAQNCSHTEFNEMVVGCEDEIRKRQPIPPASDMDRHQLLRVKLDASSRLLQFPETRPEDECLMVRSVLSDIYLIHQKYCFQTTVTRCMCERLNFERACGIQCSNLEVWGLPLNQNLLWHDFRGKLSGSGSRSSGLNALTLAILSIIITSLPLLVEFIRSPISN